MEDFQIPDAPVYSEYDGVVERELMSKLKECKGDIAVKGEEALQSAFPILHLVVRKFIEFAAATREFCWNVILHELEILTNGLVHCDIGELGHNKKVSLRNSTKILCYLAVHMAEAYENELLRKDMKEKKRKHMVDPSFVWSEERLKLMSLLVCLSNLQLMHLWEPPSPAMMEDVSACFVSICYKFLENPMIVRDKIMLEKLSELLRVTVQKYGLTLSVSMKLIQLLQNSEHSVIPISNIVVDAATKHSCKQLVLDIFREICSMDPSDLAMDSSGTKSFASFLVAVSGEIPTTVLPAVPVLLPHLNGESTTFRNGVLGILGQLLSHSGDSGAILPDTRDQMLLKLTDHIHDVNAFVRVKVLHVLLQMCSLQAIPLSHLQGILQRVIGRLMDKSSLVRKAALQLLSAMLSNNPFAAKLNKSEFARRLAEETAIIESEDSCNSVQHLAVAQYLQAALDFIMAMSGCIPVVVDMLRSKVISDALESIEFLCCANVFEVEYAKEAVSKCLPLVWSQDERLRKAVLSTYVQLYLTNNTHENCSEVIVQNLLEITANSTSGELASLEKLVGLMVSNGHIPAIVVKQLWHIYHHGSRTESSLACQLLSMVISANTSGSGLSIYLDRMVVSDVAQSKDLLLAKHTYSAIYKLAKSEEGICLSNNHSLCNQILYVLTTNFRNLETGQWIPICEQGLNVVYQLLEQPILFSEILLRDLARMLPKFDDGVDTIVLSRLLFCAGHVAQCQVVHCELNIIKERKNANHAITKGEEEELGIVGGGEEQEAVVHRVMETEVSGAGGMLTAFEPLIVCIVSNPSKFACEKLQTASALALSKYMLISSTLCVKYLQLFFTLLEKSSFSTLRANLIIAASDLVCRFPNTIEPWTPFLYSRLKDECDLVRKNAVMVLTHLILNDMIKIRGQISAMALCLEDTDTSIVELAKIFFYELSQKGNSLYNILPDVISQLTDPDSGICLCASFRSIIRYLFQFIKKEKHHESLMEKLCHRLRAARTEQQAHSLAYCLSLFVPTERGLQKLNENFSCYQDRLHDDVVFKYLRTFINKVKKLGKPEVKAQGEELEKRMHAVLQVCEVATAKTDSSASPILSDCSPNKFNSFKVDVLSEARKELTYY